MDSQRGRTRYNVQNNRQEWVARVPTGVAGLPTSFSSNSDGGSGDFVPRGHPSGGNAQTWHIAQGPTSSSSNVRGGIGGSISKEYSNGANARNLREVRGQRVPTSGAMGYSSSGTAQALHIAEDRRRNGNMHRGEGRLHSESRRWRGSDKPMARDGVKVSQNEGKRVLKLDMPQLVQEIQDNLMKGTVECMICYDMVRRSAAIWTCSSCYSIFHLTCIKKWARAPTSIDLSAEKIQGFNWRCPGCQAVQLTEVREIQYICFCGKRADPPSDLYLVPHSCGEPCGKPLEKGVLNSRISSEDLCPHHCVLQCHPGPCPPCKSFAPPRLCPCGKKMIMRRCSERMFSLSCGKPCSKLLNCSRHRCTKPCHVDPCDPCDVFIDAMCYCKKKFEAIRCDSVEVEGEVIVGDGIFSCSSPCGKKLKCGKHTCRGICHVGACPECDLIPSKISTCYCGKTPLTERRVSCVDPIPTCAEICGKGLLCGIHHCKESCHGGCCPPCLVSVRQSCRCGSTSRMVECCKTTGGEMFICEKQCGRKKNCGRHRCSERCCVISSDSERDPHFCMMVCGKKLRCGQHTCESLCHTGHCPPCLETIFTDLSCACGRTSIPPPIPCGTPYPSCQYPCSAAQVCGHPTGHICHFGDCPPCSVPVAKECIGGHVVIRNIPCGSREIRCNKVCGKNRKCGMHTCGRPCHPPPCETNSAAIGPSCGQTCGAPRRDCQHSCTAVCHPFSPCPDSRCDFSVVITCSCGRITATVHCDAGGGASVYADNVLEASLPVPLKPVEPTGTRVPLGERKFTCNEECARVERKRVLADAFDVTPTMDALNLDENSVFSETMMHLFRRDPKWVLAIEDRCRFLVVNRNRGRLGGLGLHVFSSMVKEKRDAVKVIADRWKLSVNSAGWEPKRFIVVSLTSKSKPPARALVKRGSIPGNPIHPSPFDHVIDMDPRVVVLFQDLPNDSDISALVLRFGGECELVWLNDRNALAVFNNPARAATALRRLEHVSPYQGACSVIQSGGESVPGKSDGTIGAWKKVVVQDPAGPTDVQILGEEAPIDISENPWSVLDSGTGSSSLENREGTAVISTASASCSRDDKSVAEVDEVVDDWEDACE